MVFQRVGDPLLDAPRVCDGVFLAALALVAAWLASPANAAVAEEALPTSQERTAAAGDRRYPKYPDPDAVQRIRLCVAIRRDDAETVLELLDVVDVERTECAPVLNEAARLDSWRVAEALLDAGFDGDGAAGWFTPLHTAARYESAKVAALLLERGANVDAVDGAGGAWTPLHVALLSSQRRPALRVANLLLEHGADVNARTLVMGWTPLHLAADLSDSTSEPEVVLEMVQVLIERGADVHTRTRIGGWTPAVVARHLPGENWPKRDSDLSKAVLAALQAAGGKEERCRRAPTPPYYFSGPGRWQGLGQRQPGCEYDLPFSVPSALFFGTRGMNGTVVRGVQERLPVQGAFTARGAEERLLFDAVGGLDGQLYDLVVLQDRHGNISPVVGIDWRTSYRGLCFDRESGTHTAIFRHDCEASSCLSATTYFHYDAAADTLVEAFADFGAFARPGEDRACRWREGLKKTGLEGVENVWEAAYRQAHRRASQAWEADQSDR